MKKLHSIKFLALGLLAAAGAASGAGIYKADNGTALNLGSSWVNNLAPGAGDIAVWDSTVSAANATNSPGANLAWRGIQILNPGAPVQITSGFTLTNGAGGIDLSQAAQDLNLSNNVVLGAPQSWSVASGRTLTLGGQLNRNAGGVIRFGLPDAGANAVLTNPPNALLQSGAITFGTVNDVDFAAIDGSQRVVGGASLGLYLSNPAGATPSISGTSINKVYDFNTSDSGSYGIRASGNAVIYGVRINQTNANSISWQLNADAKTLTLNSILITTNAGSLPARVTGTSTGFLRIGSTGNGELLLFQNNPAASLIFASGLNSISQQAAGASVTKLGVGTVEIQVPGTYTGGTRIYAGTLLLSGGGNIGAGPLNVFGGNFTGATGATNFAPVTVYSGGTNVIAVGGANGQFFQATNLFLGAGSRLQFSYSNGIALSSSSAPLVITNTGTTLFATNSVGLDIIGSLTVGQFPLIKYAALGGNGFAAFTLGNIQPHVSAYLTNNTAGNSIDLVVTANNDPLKWAAGSGAWDVNTTANWKDATGAAATYQQSGIFADTVTFEDSASGTSPITVTVNTALAPVSVTVNSTKNYTISGAGGLGGSGLLVKSGAGTLTLATANSFSGGLGLNGGVLNFSALANLGAGGLGFDGGTLQFAAGNSADISVRPVTFNAGGATIDTGGNAVFFANPIGNNGAGGLTKTGNGTLTLNGTNKFSGNTVVSAGTLALGSSGFISNSPAIIVNNGATLDVSAGSPLVLQNQILAGGGTIIGGVSVAGGAILSPATNGVAGTLTLNSGDLTVNGGALAFDISAAAHDLLVVNGNLNLTGGTVQLLVGGTLANGAYKLVQYSGSLTGVPANLTVTGFSQAGKVATLSSANANEIDLVVSSAGGANLVWQGDGGNNFWDVGVSANWKNTGGTATVFNSADNVTFDDSSANPSVNLLAAVQPASVTVNATANNYTFQDGSGIGAGKISGATGLVKSGGGTLTVLTANNNSGPTTISAGVLQIGNGSKTGDLGTGNITNNGTVIFAQPDNRSVAGQVSGTGALTQQGGATLTLTANNSYAGGTLVSSGTLQVGAGGSTGTLGGGAVDNEGTLVVNRAGAYALTNAVSGAGSLVNVGSGTVTLAGNNTYQGGTVISNGVVKLGGSQKIPAAGALYLDGTLDLNGFNETVNTLNGNTGVVTNSGTVGTNTLVVGDDADASTFNGVITENSSGAKLALVKQGAATLQLNSASSYSGGTLVLGGQLNIGPTAVIGGSTANITLTNGTTLNLAQAGSAHVTANNTVTILPGNTATLSSGNQANIYNGNLAGTASSSNLINSSITFGQLATRQFQSFLGTVVIQSLGTVRFSASGAVTVNGGDNTTFDLEGFLYTKSGGTIALGALVGGGTVSSPTAGSQTLVVGGKGIDSTFSGTISPGTSLVKVGAGTLTLNGTLSHDGATTVSNGVLSLASDSTSLDSSPSILLGSSTAVIDVSGRTDGTLFLGNSAAQTLSGNGTIRGSLSQAAGSTVNVSPGVLSITNTATFSGAVNLFLNRTNGVNAGRISAPVIVVNPAATLTVTNAGPALQGGEVFHLFNQPVTGFALVTLPAIASPLAWSDKLAVDGTLVVLGSLVNTNATGLTNSFSGGNLSLSWPADHIGWHLQVQTNVLSSGLGTNWVDVANTAATNQFTVPVNPAFGSVFYRLTYP
ncbi:MAG: autotransporter-associated beta strand repeat-containing protein [Verrucomicrobiae bacterium]|nr:autotransporter-associated beta strand repeat-containing protein [Verrucomicrobiae bacterium]